MPEVTRRVNGGESERIEFEFGFEGAPPLPETYIAHDGTVRRWRYVDGVRPRACCYDCARPYESIGDCVVPDEVWERINPTEHRGAGLLCANCIIERLHVLGISGVDAKLW